MPQTRPRLLILGMDGADPHLISDWIADGELPAFTRLRDEGFLAPLRSTIPPLTPVAWNTFMTGVNAGAHGVFDWRQFTDADGSGAPVKPSVRTLWRLLSDRGLRVGVMNVPATYPPESVNGFVVSGPESPGFTADMASPPEAFETLARATGGYDPFPTSIQSPEGDLDEMARQVEAKTVGAAALLERFPTDVAMVCYIMPDWVSHAFIGNRALRAPDGRVVEDMMLHTYRMMDAKLAYWLDNWADADTTVLVMSDHGSKTAASLINLDRLCAQHGWLAYRSTDGASARGMAARDWGVGLALRTWRTAKRLLPARVIDRVRGRARKVRDSLAEGAAKREVDWSRTTAVPFGGSVSGYVRLNVEGRESQGRVPREDYERVREEIREALLAERDPVTGRALFEAVHRREDVYAGPRLDDAPDLVLVPRDWDYAMPTARAILGSFPLAEVQPTSVMPADPPWGIHAPYGVLLARGPRIRAGAEPRDAGLEDLAPTILHLLGQAIPTYMEGRVLEEALDDADSPHPSPTYVEEDPEVGATGAERAYTESQQRALEGRLADLGYL